jgi:putative peptidoglycan lipid II flippase
VSGSEASASRQIARASGVVMVGYALSSLTGLASQMLVARAFGSNLEYDSFLAGNRLTELLFNLMAGGALASAFIPTFTGFLAKDQRRQAWRLASSIGNLILIGLGAISALAAWMAPWLVQRILAPGFSDPAQVSLTVELLRIMLLSPAIFGISGLLMGVLNGHQRFFLPALAPGFYRIGLIIGVVFLSPRYGIHGLAWGVVLGASLHLLIQLPGLRNLGGGYSAHLDLKDAAVRQVGLLMTPRLLGQAVVQINFLVNTILASGMPVGSLSAVSYALMIMLMPQLVIAQAIAVAALPTFSAQVARQEWQGLQASFTTTLRGVLYLALPASLGLIALRQPIVAMLLERGLFTPESTSLVAWALLWYAAGLVGHALLEVIVRAFYAMYDTRTPVVIGVGAMTLNVLFSLLFSRCFVILGWAPHGGLALANSLATGLEAALLLYLMRKRLGGLPGSRLGTSLLRMSLAGGSMALVLVFWMQLQASTPVVVQALGGIVLGALVYWITALLLRVEESRRLAKLLLRRNRNGR